MNGFKLKVGSMEKQTQNTLHIGLSMSNSVMKPMPTNQTENCICALMAEKGVSVSQRSVCSQVLSRYASAPQG